MKNNLLYIISLFLFISCSKNSTGDKIVNKPVSVPVNYKAELLQYFQSFYNETSHNQINNASIDSIQWLDSLYKLNNYKTLWISDSIRLSENGAVLIQQLAQANNYGIDTRFYTINTLLDLKKEVNKDTLKNKKFEAASKLELLLSYYYMQHGRHLNAGVLDSIDSLSILPRKVFNINLPEYLSAAHKKDSLIHKLLNLQPKHPEYIGLQKGLEKFIKKGNFSTNNVRVINFRKDSIKAAGLAKEALVLHRYLQEEHKDSLYHEALTKFQQEHGLAPDGLIGKNTAKALSISPYGYYQKIVASLERWRWKEDWSSSYIYVNIPSYQLKVVKEGKIEKRHKVVIGKIKNPTPEIIDTLEYIIAYPYWNVPRSISVKEILLKAKKDSTYLTRNNYEVLTYQREALDHTLIDWTGIEEKNFNFLIRQRGGSSNSLGLVKFIFPNKYAIYLHDTPSKYYFNLETRAYSHGCVRVHKALNLAEYLLESDDNRYTIDSVYKYIRKQKEKPMRLNQKLPIYLYYSPVVADSTGSITFYNDVYGLDEKLIKEMALKRQ